MDAARRRPRAYPLNRLGEVGRRRRGRRSFSPLKPRRWITGQTWVLDGGGLIAVPADRLARLARRPRSSGPRRLGPERKAQSGAVERGRHSVALEDEDGQLPMCRGTALLVDEIDRRALGDGLPERGARRSPSATRDAGVDFMPASHTRCALRDALSEIERPMRDRSACPRASPRRRSRRARRAPP